MIVHVMQNSVFAAPYIEFVLEHFDRRQHRFLIVGGADPDETPIPDAPEVLVRVREFARHSSLPRLARFLSAHTSDADRIVLHGLFDPRTILFLFAHPRRTKRSCWVIWGGDLHMYELYRSHWATGVADRLIRGRVFKNLGFLVALAPGDVSALTEAYGVTKSWTVGMYVNVVTAEHLNEQPPRVRPAGDPVRILVGNSASPSNKHAEVLELLAGFEHEAMEVLVPLSYGDPQYARLVRSLGRELLGERFLSLDSFMAPRDYAALLSTIDVAIFNHARQQALGNYFALAYLGAKIYTRIDGPSARYLAGHMGVPLFDISSITSADFEEFAAMAPSDRERARGAAEAFYDPDRLAEVWRRVFDDPV